MCPAGKNLLDFAENEHLHDNETDCVICPVGQHSSETDLDTSCIPCSPANQEGATKGDGCPPTSAHLDNIRVFDKISET